MRRGLTAFLAVALTGAAVAESARAAVQGCPNVPEAGDVVQATNVSCATARRVTTAWADLYRQDGISNRLVLGFYCRLRELPFEGGRVYCSQGRRKVSFYPTVAPPGAG